MKKNNECENQQKDEDVEGGGRSSVQGEGRSEGEKRRGKGRDGLKIVRFNKQVRNKTGDKLVCRIYLG